MKLGFLRLVSDGDGFPYHSFLDLAREMGFTVEYPNFGDLGRLEDAKRGWSASQRLLEDADTLILNGLPLEHAPELVQRFHRRIDSGTRALVFPDHSDKESIDWWANFLDRYYVRPTPIKMVGGKWGSSRFEFRKDDNCFRDTALFAGVDTVVADQPWALWYGGEAFPVLVGPRPHCWGVQASTDRKHDVETSPYLRKDWNGREMVCMAVWYGNAGGAILVASTTSSLTDIGIQSNRAFVRNVLRFLSTQSAEAPTPKNMSDRIERNLADFVLGVLKELGDRWWDDGVPQPIRTKTEIRREEGNNRFEREAYLDLVDYKKIMAKNWGLFEPHFGTLGRHDGKEKTLGFFNRLIEVRNLIAHPTRMHLSGYSLSSDERQLLADSDALSLKLVAGARRRSAAVGTDGVGFS